MNRLFEENQKNIT